MLRVNLEEFLKSIHFNIENQSECRERTDHMATFRCRIGPADAITLRCNHSTNHILTKEGTRARNERPPAGPEKYTEVLGNDMSKQNFRFFSSSENGVFGSENQKFRVMEPVAWDRITFLFRNVGS